MLPLEVDRSTSKARCIPNMLPPRQSRGTALYMTNNLNDVFFDRNMVGTSGPTSSAVGFSPTGTHHMCGTSKWSGSSPPPPPAHITYPGTYGGTPSNNVCP